MHTCRSEQQQIAWLTSDEEGRTKSTEW